MTTHPDHKVPLSSPDRERMSQLYEEVAGRLKEMALITARVLGIPPDATQGVRLTPTDTGPKDSSAQFRYAIVCGTDSCGCYDYEAGLCYEC